MKTYTLTGAQAFTHKPEHPERTARRPYAGPVSSPHWGDVLYMVWPSRAAMLQTIAMQEKRAPKLTDWRACS
jgi:hypothetical protein